MHKSGGKKVSSLLLADNASIEDLSKDVFMLGAVL